MGYLYKGDAILKGNLAVNTPKPLDERSIVQNAAELLTINSNYAYNGMPVVSIDEAAIYILLDKTNISSLDSWKKIGNVIIDGNEVDLSSFVTTSELETQLNTFKTEISNNVDTKISTAVTSVEQALNVVNSHISNSSNPHNVTKYQIGLSLVENIAPIDMPLSNATKQAIEEALSWNE